MPSFLAKVLSPQLINTYISVILGALLGFIFTLISQKREHNKFFNSYINKEIIHNLLKYKKEIDKRMKNDSIEKALNSYYILKIENLITENFYYIYNFNNKKQKKQLLELHKYCIENNVVKINETLTDLMNILIKDG